MAAVVIILPLPLEFSIKIMSLEVFVVIWKPSAYLQDLHSPFTSQISSQELKLIGNVSSTSLVTVHLHRVHECKKVIQSSVCKACLLV